MLLMDSRKKPAERHGRGLEPGPDPGSVGHVKAPHHVTCTDRNISNTRNLHCPHEQTQVLYTGSDPPETSLTPAVWVGSGPRVTGPFSSPTAEPEHRRENMLSHMICYEMVLFIFPHLRLAVQVLCSDWLTQIFLNSHR